MIAKKNGGEPKTSGGEKNRSEVKPLLKWSQKKKTNKKNKQTKTNKKKQTNKKKR